MSFPQENNLKTSSVIIPRTMTEENTSELALVPMSHPISTISKKIDLVGDPALSGAVAIQMAFPLRLEKETTSWLDGKTAYEYHPDPLVFKATAVSPELPSGDYHRDLQEWCSRALGTPKEEVMNYYGLYQEKFQAKVVQYQKAKHKFGRGRPQDWFAMATMERVVRSTLWSEYYTDFDIENAHPVILSQILKGHYECPHLDYYVANRDAMLHALMEKHSIDRDTAKEYICAVFFGQSHHPVKDAMLTDFMEERNGNEEVKGWARVLKEANPHIYETARQKNMTEKQENRTFKHINTMVSWILQEYEYRLFCAVFEWAEGQGLLTAPEEPKLAGKSVFSYIYDGGCMLTSAVEVWKRKNGKTLEDLLRQFSDVGFAKTGIRVRWTAKDWGRKIDIDDCYLELKQRPRIQSLLEDPMMSHEDYTRIWETTHLKITGRGVYVEEGQDGVEAKIRDEQQLVKCYGHLWNGLTEGKCPQRKNWLKTWMNNNHTIRSKEDMDIYPNPDLCPANIYNLWVPFYLTRVKKWVQKDDAVKFIVSHIRNVMCPDGDAQANYMLDWVAHMIQKPEEKVGKCPIFTSRGGVGKGRTIDFFKKLLGEDKVYDPEKPDRDVWGEFNGAMKNAFLVVLDELAQHKTTKSMGEFKHIITEPTISIRLMRTDPFKMRSFHRFMANTNDENAGVEVGQDNRRFWVNRASEKYRGDTEYWNQFDAWINDKDAMKSVFEYFKERKIESDFRNPQATPLTAYHKALVRENTPSVDLWMEAVARQNWTERKTGNPVLVWSAVDTLKRYLSWCEETSNKPETEQPNTLSRILSMREYGLCGATSSTTTKKGAQRTINCDKLLGYFKGTGIINEDEWGAVSVAEEDPQRTKAIADAIEAKMRAQQEKALIQKVFKDVGKKMSGEAKNRMLSLMKGATKKAIGGECETEEATPRVEYRGGSVRGSRVPTRQASPETSEDDMEDLE